MTSTLPNRTGSGELTTSRCYMIPSSRKRIDELILLDNLTLDQAIVQCDIESERV